MLRGSRRSPDVVGQREQLVLAVEERQLATVARRELEHAERRVAVISELPDREERVDHARSGTPGRRGRRTTARTGNGRRGRSAHFMFRSIETQMSSAGTPRATSAFAVNLIMISGPQRKAVVRAGSNRAAGPGAR